MFNLFGGKNNTAEEKAQMEQLNALETRWSTFLIKLEEKYDEVIEAIEMEAPQIYKEDEDQFKRAYQRFKSGMEGQLTNIQKKAYETKDKQILTYYNSHDYGAMHPSHDALYEWRSRCLDLHNKWENRINAKRNAVFAKIEQQTTDLEAQYTSILNEYEAIKNKFKCKQCSSPLSIDTIYFISTYITCPSCRTQNTFEPGTQIRTLEHIARPLAEQRTKHLHQQYEQHIYNGPHDNSEQRRKGKEIETAYYEKYLRAMFNEMNRIIPEKHKQNEQFYERLLADYKQYNS